MEKIGRDPELLHRLTDGEVSASTYFYPAETGSESPSNFLLPATTAVDAFARVRALYGVLHPTLDRTTRSIGILQHYILNPDCEESWSIVVDHWRYLRAVRPTSSDLMLHETSRIFHIDVSSPDFEQATVSGLSRKEKARLGALLQVAAIIAGERGPLPNWSKDLIMQSNGDKSLRYDFEWAQPFFLNGFTETLLKRTYLGLSSTYSILIFFAKLNHCLAVTKAQGLRYLRERALSHTPRDNPEVLNQCHGLSIYSLRYVVTYDTHPLHIADQSRFLYQACYPLT